jgi:hypothetical protein
LRDPLRAGWLGCLRTRAMNPGPFHGRDGSPSRPIEFSSSLGRMPKLPDCATARINRES